jgi:ubiquinone/menaquinone biosynthesis C-methylase UbiE
MEEEQLKEFARQLRKPEGDAGREMGEKMNSSNRYINQYTIEELNPKANDTILELGMGNGFFVKDILAFDPGVRYTGCDFSQDMVDESSLRNQKFVQEGRAKFVWGEAENLPFEDASFDKAFTINTVYFWENREKVLDEFYRVLKPLGKLLIAIRPKLDMEQMPFTKYGFAMFSKEDLVALLSANRFRVTEVVEKMEPEREVNGRKITIQTVIVCAEK